MAPQQYLLRGPSLDDVARQAVELYGPDARIVSADRVLDSGVAGLLGRRHVEATVHVPDAVARLVPSVGAGPHILASRAGIAALLDDADSAEDALHASLPVSTEAERFGELLERLRSEMDPPDERVPTLLDGAGDLVLVVGPGDVALAVVRSMTAQNPSAWCLVSAGEPGTDWLSCLGKAGDWPHLEDARDAVAARAAAVESGATVLAACGLRVTDRQGPQFGRAAALRADQVWLAVDARHKADETAEWVAAATSRLGVDALAVVGARETRTPQTVNSLGVPVGWVDGIPAPRTVL